MRWMGRIVLAVSGVITTAGCSSSSASGAPAPSGSGDAGATVSTFTQVYADVLSPMCGMACHNPAGIGVSGGHLDMSSQATAYTNLVNAAAAGEACGGKGTRVVPKMAASSLLFEKVDPAGTAPCGDHMPLGGSPISDAQASEIESWINAGALDD